MSSPENAKGHKLVFVGDSGVGKTCIITRYVQGIYKDNVASTMGASYATKTIEIPETNQTFTFDIWDTAGQEKYKALAKFFFQGAKMAVLVYDITLRDSFDSMKNSWYKQLRDNAPQDIVIGVAGNKSDLYEQEEVSEQEAREFAKSIGAVFKLTSAQKNRGIDELFVEIGKAFLEYNSGKKVKKSQIKDDKNNIIIGQNGKKKEEHKRKFC